MKKIVLLMFCLLTCYAGTNAQTVTKTTHKKAIKTDVVTTGTLTIRKPSYVCISTDNDRDQLITAVTRCSLRSSLSSKLLSTDVRCPQAKT